MPPIPIRNVVWRRHISIKEVRDLQYIAVLFDIGKRRITGNNVIVDRHEIRRTGKSSSLKDAHQMPCLGFILYLCILRSCLVFL